MVVEERSVDFSEDELVAHGAVGHHAEGVVDDAAVAGPSQFRGRPPCEDTYIDGYDLGGKSESECLMGYRQMWVRERVRASRFICYEKTRSWM